MSPISDLVLRVLAAVWGVPLAMAFFLYENEDGGIQSRLEAWWIKLDDKQAKAYRLAARFIQALAGLTGQLFDAVFGRELLSLRACVASLSLSIAAFFSTVIFLLAIGVSPTSHQISYAGGFGYLFLFVMLAACPSFLQRSEIKLCGASIPLVWIWCFLVLAEVVVPLTVVVDLVGSKWGRAPAEHLAVGLTVLFAFSVVCDSVCVATLRHILRSLENSQHVVGMAGLVILNIVFAGFFFFAPFLLGLYLAAHSRFLRAAGELLLIGGFAFNGIDIAVCLTFVVIGLALVLHHAIWPITNRFLYALQRCGIAPRRRLGIVGFFLLCYAVGGNRLLHAVRLLF